MRPQRTRAGFHGNLTAIGSTHRRGQHGQQLPRLCSNRAHAFVASETRRAVSCELLRKQAIHVVACAGNDRWGKRAHRRSCSYLHNDVGQDPLARERVQKGASFFLKNTSKKVILVKKISPRRKKPPRTPTISVRRGPTSRQRATATDLTPPELCHVRPSPITTAPPIGVREVQDDFNFSHTKFVVKGWDPLEISIRSEEAPTRNVLTRTIQR